ncbi:MAG: hypothetical protein B6D77_07400 [gamma proteobacterium symbiont of Ctena orbiculata]|nr:MAG: hypothetical protein B6D77_07400 [gamma proteobacterium symbiont of Ctena orbiculata]PVV18686.1 MAG: hypothetical protein B6D78_15615 [gamma proteobacterium symbiont of Ctena orbiculata]PVV27093.1 MAG: hypothetical protein B6D79_04145 [gamma proteobacterium symbiont of Ctena orbiculata]
MTAEELKQQIQGRSGKIKEFRALLNDPDQTVRLAALDVMLKSDDIAMRELAFGMGFSSADEAMRAVALKNKFADQKMISVKIAKITSPSDTQKKALKDWGSIYTFNVKDFDEKTGQFTTKGSYRGGTGQLNGTRIEFSQQYCSGSFQLGDGAVLGGELGCSGGWNGTFEGQITLQ